MAASSFSVPYQVSSSKTHYFNPFLHNARALIDNVENHHVISCVADTQRRKRAALRIILITQRTALEVNGSL